MALCRSLLAVFSVLSLAAVVVGCAAPPQAVGEGYSHPDGAEVGYVLASVTAEGGNNARFMVRALGDGAEWPLDARGTGLVGRFMPRGVDLGLEEGYGRLVLVPLAPGHHELTRWGLLLGRGAGEQRWLQPAGLPPISFAVRAGEITYLGNLHLAVEHGGPELLPGVLRPVRAVSARIRPQAERDLAALRKHHPSLGTLPLRPSIAFPPAWARIVRRDHEE